MLVNQNNNSMGKTRLPSKLSGSIRIKLIFYFSLFFVVILTAIVLLELKGIPFIPNSGTLNQLKIEAARGLNLVADLKKGRILRWIEERRDDIHAFSQNDFTATVIVGLGEEINKYTKRDIADAKLWAPIRRENKYISLLNHLNNIKVSYEVYERILVADAKTGIVFISTDEADIGSDISPKEYFAETLRSTCSYTSDIELSQENNNPVIYFCHIIKDDEGQAVAILVMENNVDEIIKPMLHTGEGLGERGEALLINKDVRILTSLKHPLADGTKAEPLEYRIQAKPAILAARGKEGIIETEDYRGEPVLAAYRYIQVNPEWGWGMVVKRDKAELFAPMEKNIIYSCLITIIGILAFIGLAVVLSRKLTQPILSLSHTADKVAKGDLTARTPVTTSDEVGALAATFNSMIERVHNWYKELEKQVDIRTIEIKSANEQLQQEISERKRMEKTLRLIFEGTAKVTGKDFLRSLVRHLASATDFRYVFVGEVVKPGKDTIRTLAVWADQDYGENFEYNLEGTPCQNVVQQDFCFYPQGVQNQFPKDYLLAKMGVESYMGLPLTDSSGNTIGLLVGLHDKPIDDPKFAQQILEIFAARTVAEMERKRAEDILKGSREKYRNLVEVTSDWVWEIDENIVYTYVSPQIRNILGYESEEVLGKTPFNLMPPEEAQRVAGILKPIYTNQQSFRNLENTNIHKDGRLVVLETNGIPIYDKDGNFQGYRGIDRDITERKQADEKLRKSESNYHTIFDSAYDAIFIHDIESGEILDANKRMSEMFGYTLDEVKQININDLSSGEYPYTQAEALRLLEKVAKGQPQVFEWMAKNKDNKLFWIEVNLRCVTIDEKKCALAVVRDIAERKQAEKALLESEVKYRSMFTNMLDGFAYHKVLYDEDGTPVDYVFLVVNDKFEKYTGFKRSDIIGKRVTEVIPEIANSEPDLIKIYGNVALTEESTRFEIYFAPLNKYYSISAYSPQKDYFVALFHDITERKLGEEELRTRQKVIEELNINLEKRVYEEVEKSRQKDLVMTHQSRLAAMGQMIGHIAHQWKQPLNALNILLYNIKDSFDNNELTEEILENLTEKGAELVMKMSTTIDDFRNFFKPSKEKEKFNINKIIKNSLSIVGASFKHNNINVKMKEKEEIITTGFPNEYSQVILNVLNNAKDAIVDRGIKGRIKIDIFHKNNSGVVKITDNGGGIPEDIFNFIFDPYFTTRPEGKGSGMGLYISKMIIEEHMKGKIDVHNLKNGAEFDIITPLTPN